MRDRTFELWKASRSLGHVWTAMCLEGYSPAQFRYIKRWVKQWERSEQNDKTG
jgi:hypothetical protein